ncbi:MAG: hypothetical protein OEU92_11040 [Alphaproteobacteria bacterium]|nr:hypothetical protein [Alphaproteobacteria bacterium]
MPLENRVTPEGEIVAISERGLFMGNRGILHDAEQRLRAARWKHPHWIICVLAFKGWHREVMQPNAYTELFFMDEATALAAGHRPCALCRRAAYLAFQDALKAALHRDRRLDANALDRMLHAARIETGTRRQRRFEADIGDLPDGAMIAGQEGASRQRAGDVWLVLGRHLLRWRPGGYDRVVRRPSGVAVEVLTPRPTVLALQQGYRPDFHPNARELTER